MCFIGESGQQIEFKFEKKRLFYLPHNRSKTSVGVVNVRYDDEAGKTKSDHRKNNPGRMGNVPIR